MKEIELGKKIQLMASSLGHSIFRCNRGIGWVGKAIRFSETMKIEVHAGDVLIKKARPLHAGLVDGNGDFIGYSSTGKFISVEIKTETGIIRPDQITWCDAVNKAGGIAGIVRDEETAFELLS